MFSHIFENSVNSFLLPARMIYQEAPGKAPRPGISAYFSPKTPSETKDEPAPTKKPETDANKPKEGSEGEKKAEEKTKKDLEKLKKGISKSPFENPGEHKKIREAIEKLTPQQLKEYYDTHEPEKYNGRMWLEWNMDFVKNVMLIKDATALTARKYAWVFQEWLRDKRFNPGVDGRIGKKTTEALGGYLCSIGGNDDICKKIGGKPGETAPATPSAPELNIENWGQYYDIYKQALKKGYPNLDVGVGYVVDMDVFKEVFADIVDNQASFDPYHIEGWEGQFADVLGLVPADDLFKIYPYSLEEKYKLRAQQAEEEVKLEPVKEIPKEYKDKINKRESETNKQVSAYMLNSVPDMTNKLKEFYKHNESIQSIKNNYKADMDRFKSDTIARGPLYADRAVGVKEAHDNFLAEYKAWKKEKLSYDEDIKGTETESTDIGKRRKEKLENAEDAKNHEYNILKKAVQTYYSELARLNEKIWEDYEKRMRDEISRYDFPAEEKVNIENISNVSYKEYGGGGGGIRADTDVTLATTNYAEAVKKHQNYLLGGISGGLEKYLWKVPQRVIQKPEDLDIYIRRDGAGFERNKVAIGKVARGHNFVETVNHFIYFNNYLRMQERALGIQRSVMRDASNGADKVNKVALASLLQNRNEAETRLA